MPGEKIYGPYPHRNGWRIVVISGGRRATRQCKTEQEAYAVIARFRDKAQARTVEVAVEEYVRHLTTRGNKPRSRETTETRLRGLLAAALSWPLEDLTARRAAHLYERYAQGRATDTHRNALNQTKTWARWCVRQGWWRNSPFAEVEGLGKRSAGKAQLLPDEARRFAFVALLAARTGDRGALGVLLALTLGLRAGELVGLLAREVNAEGRLVVIARAKTRAGVRALEVPELLAPLLWQATQAAGKGRVFPYRREWVRDSAHRICRKAQVPLICAHALRGMHATLAVEAGQSAHLVAAQLGHTSAAITERHYMAPMTMDRARARMTGEKISEFFSPGVAPDSLRDKT